MTQLMISVRSVDEVAVAVKGGAGIIDVKEPRNGPLGMASPEPLRQIVSAVPDSMPIGASLGEWSDWQRRGLIAPDVPARVRYLKVGLANVGEEVRSPEWRRGFSAWRRQVESKHGGDDVRWVAVLYADFDAVGAPPPDAILELAADGFRAVLVDTAAKRDPKEAIAGSLGGLFDALDESTLRDFVVSARRRGLEVALSGALTVPGVAHAAVFGADFVGVRTAACRDGQRDGVVDEAAVRRLAESIAHVAAPETPLRSSTSE